MPTGGAHQGCRLLVSLAGLSFGADLLAHLPARRAMLFTACRRLLVEIKLSSKTSSRPSVHAQGRRAGRRDASAASRTDLVLRVLDRCARRRDAAAGRRRCHARGLHARSAARCRASSTTTQTVDLLPDRISARSQLARHRATAGEGRVDFERFAGREARFQTKTSRFRAQELHRHFGGLAR